MRGWFAGLMIGLLGAAAPVVADDHPVVVELFTSQGCSSCPPADALLRELATRSDVIALALHVDYWDYIGWKDKFASPQFTERQKAYARAAGHRTIFTPQMIVAGTDHVVGNKPMRLAELIEAHSDQPVPVRIEMIRAGDNVVIRADAVTDVPGGMVVQIVRYLPTETVKILRGENAGKTFTYANIVTEWRVIGRWNGAAPLEMTAEAPGPEPVVALVQAPKNGPILGAAQLR